jgi:metal-sulfur cluster biosynthetic enzyme
VQPSPDVAAIRRTIDGVLDPCSRFNGANLSFVELGMVESIDVRDGGEVVIGLLLDDPTCVYLGAIRREIREAVLTVPGVESVEFMLIADRWWTEERLSDAGRAKLESSRAAKRAKLIPLELLMGRGGSSGAS